MEKISGFFEKFKGKVAGQVQNLVFISEIIKKHTGIEIEMKNIGVSGGILRLKASSLEKNEIYIKKTHILKEINEKMRSLVLKDIR